MKPNLSNIVKQFENIYRKVTFNMQNDRVNLKYNLDSYKPVFEILQNHQKQILRTLKLLSTICGETSQKLHLEISGDKKGEVNELYFDIYQAFIDNMLKPFCKINYSIFPNFQNLSVDAEKRMLMVLKLFDDVSEEVLQAFKSYQQILSNYEKQISKSYKTKVTNSSIDLTNQTIFGLKSLYLQAEKLVQICKTYDEYVSLELSTIALVMVKKVTLEAMNEYKDAYISATSVRSLFVNLISNDMGITSEISFRYEPSLFELAKEILVNIEKVVICTSIEQYDNSCTQITAIYSKLNFIDYNALLFENFEKYIFKEESLTFEAQETFFNSEILRFKEKLTYEACQVMVDILARDYRIVDPKDELKNCDVIKKNISTKTLKHSETKQRRKTTNIKATISHSFVANAKNFINVNKEDSVMVLAVDGRGNVKIETTDSRIGYVPHSILKFDDADEESKLAEKEIALSKKKYKNKSFRSVENTGIILYADDEPHISNARNANSQSLPSMTDPELGVYNDIDPGVPMRSHNEGGVYDMPDLEKLKQIKKIPSVDGQQYVDTDIIRAARNSVDPTTIQSEGIYDRPDFDEPPSKSNSYAHESEYSVSDAMSKHVLIKGQSNKLSSKSEPVLNIPVKETHVFTSENDYNDPKLNYETFSEETHNDILLLRLQVIGKYPFDFHLFHRVKGESEPEILAYIRAQYLLIAPGKIKDVVLSYIKRGYMKMASSVGKSTQQNVHCSNDKVQAEHISKQLNQLVTLAEAEYRKVIRSLSPNVSTNGSPSFEYVRHDTISSAKSKSSVSTKDNLQTSYEIIDINKVKHNRQEKYDNVSYSQMKPPTMLKSTSEKPVGVLYQSGEDYQSQYQSEENYQSQYQSGEDYQSQYQSGEDYQSQYQSGENYQSQYQSGEDYQSQYQSGEDYQSQYQSGEDYPSRYQVFTPVKSEYQDLNHAPSKYQDQTLDLTKRQTQTHSPTTTKRPAQFVIKPKSPVKIHDTTVGRIKGINVKAKSVFQDKTSTDVKFEDENLYNNMPSSNKSSALQVKGSVSDQAPNIDKEPNSYTMPKKNKQESLYVNIRNSIMNKKKNKKTGPQRNDGF